jgi:molybdopterin-containing oxidoreductase family membrane subunit
MGRPWLAYWVLPIPNQFGSLWVNFNSPLLWDVFAISTYLSVSLVFWWTGLLPDLAMIRDRAITPFTKRLYSILSFGWSGRAKDWQRFEEVSLVLAGLATPLVLSVHTIVSYDFATSIVPGWHTTIFPPYFVAGAVFSGFAMVNTLLIIMRKVSRLENYITIQHIELMNIVIMITGSIVGVAYITELFIAWYSGVEYEQYAFLNRATGPYWWAYWAMMTCNVFSPQFMWFPKLRRSIMFSFFISIVVNIGMWFERFVIIVTSLHRDYLPSSWTMFSPTFVDIGIFIGTVGFFFVLFLLYSRGFPVIAQAEVKSILKASGSWHKKLRADKGDDARHYVMPEGASSVASTEETNDKAGDLLSKLGSFDPNTQTRDDLKEISGIGPKMEQKLHDLGIFTFEQVSRMTDIEYDLLDSITGEFPGRAKRDDWAGQADKLKNS